MRMSWISILAKKNENTMKNTKNNSLVKNKRILNIKMSAKGGPVFTLSLSGGRIALAPYKLLPGTPQPGRHCLHEFYKQR